ncbi:MAG: site-2 protease family protein [Clostridia bacterium]
MLIYHLIESAQGDLVLALVNVFSFLLAVCTALVLHEVSHGIAALINGDNTAKLLGRLSLNPIKHFNLIGFMMMILVGFGYANPVPVNPNNFKNERKGNIQVSIAGVLTNLLLSFILILLFSIFILVTNKVSINNSFLAYIYQFMFMYFTWATVLNINFALFNILPLYPLDGYRLLNTFVPDNNKFMIFLRKYSFYVLIFFVLWGNAGKIADYSPLSLYLNYSLKGITWLFSKFWSLFGLPDLSGLFAAIT